MQRVQLWNLCGAALIVPCKSGVIYTNQANGVLCAQPECEGILIPLAEQRLVEGAGSLLEQQLCSLFSGSSWDELNEIVAQDINRILARFEETRGITVDHTQIAQSYEAWVHVIALEHQYSPYSGFGEIKGILTWSNSD